mmetsp:Transcript_9188/g.13388  ORF Transcript_9188/g.13388 Transcript_9188/m.13388 type:complete len:91 (+) Transcript_9188:213-485(+)
MALAFLGNRTTSTPKINHLAADWVLLSHPLAKEHISAMPLNSIISFIPWQQNYFYLENQSLGSRFCVALPFLGLLCGNTREHLFTLEKLL